nr:MAG TPA_asm: hypothetical protein [Caudoviricetes sp.]
MVDKYELEDKLRSLLKIYGNEYERGFNDGVRMAIAVLLNMEEKQ